MSNYIKSTDFSAKDSLLTGNPLKIVSGTEIDDELNAIQTAVNTKANSNSSNLTGTPTAPTASAGVNTTQIATTAYVTSAITTSSNSITTAYEEADTALEASITALEAAFSTLYPVGSVYTNAAVATNPATLLGFGTWESFGTGKVLVGIDDSQTEFDTVGETGGAKTHTLTVGELPAHSHLTDGTSGSNRHPVWAGGVDAIIDGQSSTSVGGQDAYYKTNSKTADTGSGTAHNILQPYIVVYMWKRTA